jgi:hypothetical protein
LIPPSSNIAKINVNVVVSRNKDRGVVVAFYHDHNGIYLGAYAIVVRGIIDPSTLEVLVCEALALVEDLSLRRLCDASDCKTKTVVAEIWEGTIERYSSVIQEIRTRSALLQKSSLVFFKSHFKL